MQFTPLQSLGQLLTRFRGKDNYTQTPVFSVSQLMQGGNPIWISENDDEGKIFNSTAELYAVIMKKASMYSNGIFKHYRMQGDEKVEVVNSPIIARLENPNPLQSRNEWLMEELIMTSVYGNSFVYGLKGSRLQDVPTALYNLPSNRMKVCPTGKIYKQSELSEIVSKYELCNYDGSREDYAVDEVMWFQLPNPENPLLGKSPVHTLQMPLSNIRGAYGYRNVLINERGAIGMISNDTKDSDGGIPLTNDEKKKIENQYSKDYGVREGKSKVLVTSSSLKWTPFTYPTKDLMLFEEIDANFQKIIDTYQMNKYLFGMKEQGTFSNVMEGKRMAYQDAIIPYAENFTFKLTSFLGLDKKNEWVELDYSHIEALQDNESEKANVIKLKSEAYTKLKETGDFSNEDLLRMLGL